MGTGSDTRDVPTHLLPRAAGELGSAWRSRKSTDEVTASRKWLYLSAAQGNSLTREEGNKSIPVGSRQSCRALGRGQWSRGAKSSLGEHRQMRPFQNYNQSCKTADKEQQNQILSL